MQHINKLVLLSGLLLAVGFTGPLHAQEVFRAFLGGANEPLPVPTPATGEVLINLQETGSLNQITVTGSFEGLTSKLNPVAVSGAHLHLGYAGQNGAPVITLNPTMDEDSLSGNFTAAGNTFNISDDQKAALRRRQMYVNIHSQNYSGGEIRGQVVPTPLGFVGLFRANLFGANQVPAVVSTGRGSVILELVGDSLFVSGTIHDLEGELIDVAGTPAHLHLGMAGMTGVVTVGLKLENDEDDNGATLLADSNRFLLNADQVAAMEQRNVYVNVHTDLHPSGELRGQVVNGQANAVFRAFLSGTQERPFVTTFAGGSLVFEVMDTTVMVSGAFDGLESDLNPVATTGFHLHTAMAGRNGGVAVTLNPSLDDDSRGGTVLDTFELTQAQLEVMFDRGIYANVHSEDHPGGEIRGQVVPEAQFYLNTYLSGTQEVKPVATTGTGFVIVEVRGDMMTASGTFDDLTSDFDPSVAGTGAHLHQGFAGQNGGVDFRLNVMSGEGDDDDNRGGVFMADSNMFMIETDGTLDTLRMRGYYVNVHSQTYGGGEVRGQLLPEATCYFVATLSGAGQTPAVMTEGYGTLIGEVRAGRDTMLTVTGMFQELTGEFDPSVAETGAHLHVGIAGRNGGVAVTLKTEATAGAEMGLFMADSNMAMLDSTAVSALRNRMIYANIHSVENQGGEIRGQMLPPANAYLMANLMGMNEVQPVMSEGSGALRLELNGDMLTVTGSFQNLDSTYAGAIGSHLHAGVAGTNGGVIVPLSAMLTDDSLAATYMADSNMFDVTPGIIDTLLSGGHYANVHSLKYPSGELRGQVLKETNFFPTATMITSPADEAGLTVEGSTVEEFTVTWDPATDPDGNRVVYIWQLAADESFETLLVNENVGTDTSFTATFGTLDLLLTGAGVEIDDNITVYHRVVTSDGSLLTPDMDSLEVTLTRGVISSVRDFLTDVVRLYPSPTEDDLTLSIDARRAGDAQVRVTDLMGRVVTTDAWQMRAGENLRTLRLNNQAPGMYVVTLTINGEPLSSHKVLKR